MARSDMLKAVTAFTFTVFAFNPPADARDDAAAAPEPTRCETSYGTIALTDGDQQGWTQFGLSSPRGMIGAMIEKSGCFTLHNAASGRPADYLMSAVAGSKEEIDQSMNLAKAALTEGFVRSGAASAVLTKVPFGGAMAGMLGGLGGKKKTVSAGLRVMSPATGQTLVAGSGDAQKSVVKIMGASEWVAASSGAMGGYAQTGDGKLLTSAFIGAYNAVVAQGSALIAARPAPIAAPAPATATATASYTVAVDTQMWAAPGASGTPVRALRAATILIPAGERQGLFVPVTDAYGTKGWVSVEALR